MEKTNKKKGKGLIITLIVLLVAFAACAALLFTGVIKSPLVKEKKCAKCTETKTTDDKKKDSKTTCPDTTDTCDCTKDEDPSKIVYNGDILRSDKDFGKVTINGKELNVKYAYSENKIYLGDNSIDTTNRGVNNIAVMGNYLVVGLDGSGYRFRIYDSEGKEVDNAGNSLGLLTGSLPQTSKWIIDEHNLIYYTCVADSSSSTGFKLETHNLKINGSNIEKVLLTTNSDVNCSSQR